MPEVTDLTVFKNDTEFQALVEGIGNAKTATEDAIKECDPATPKTLSGGQAQLAGMQDIVSGVEADRVAAQDAATAAEGHETAALQAKTDTVALKGDVQTLKNAVDAAKTTVDSQTAVATTKATEAAASASTATAKAGLASTEADRAASERAATEVHKKEAQNAASFADQAKGATFCADTTARDALTKRTGMVIYLAASRMYQRWTGAAWENLGPSVITADADDFPAQFTAITDKVEATSPYLDAEVAIVENAIIRKAKLISLINREVDISKGIGAYGRAIPGDPDAASNNTNVIQALLNNYVDLFIPDAEFYTNASLTIPGDRIKRVRGVSWRHVGDPHGGSVIRSLSADPAFLIGIPTADQTVDLLLEGFTVRGQAGTGHGVMIRRIHNMRLVNLKIEYCGGNGLELDRAFANTYRDLYINNNVGHGIHLNDLNDFGRFYGIRLLANGGNGYYAEWGDVSGTVLDSCDIEGNAIGVVVNAGDTGRNTQAFTLRDCYFEAQVGKNARFGMDAGAMRLDGLSMIGCNVNIGQGTAGQNAIDFGKVRGLHVAGCVFAGCDITKTTDTEKPFWNAKIFGGAFPADWPSYDLNGNYGFVSDRNTGYMDIGADADWGLRIRTRAEDGLLARWEMLGSSGGYALKGHQHDIRDILGISSTNVPVRNMCGSVTFSDAEASKFVDFTPYEDDADYRVLLTVSGATGSGIPAAAYTARVTLKAVSGINIALVNAPGTGNTVTVDWFLIR